MRKKKSLGQHFLHSPHYLRAIADAGNIQRGEWVVEIGPGDGALTQELLARGAKVVAIEKDARLIPFLKERFVQEIAEKKFLLYESDVLTFAISRMKLPRIYKVIANIPYYITGAVLKKFLTDSHQPALIVFLVQKEIADRIAKSTKGSILSLSVKAYGIPEVLKRIPRGAFSPAPQVDSAILRIEDISRNNFISSKHEKYFFELLHAGFGKKRKLLRRNLEILLAAKTHETFQRAGITEKARAEDVSLSQWISLAKF